MIMIKLLIFLIFLGYCYFIIIFIRKYSQYILPINRIDKRKYTLVLGAGLKKDGHPTDILADRVLTSIQLAEENKTEKLIFSGTAYHQNYDEATVMKSVAKQFGINDGQIILDKKGFTTFNSCINLRKLMDTKDLIIVTQKFHLPRAIFIARNLGFDAIGVAADKYFFSKRKILFWYLREFLSIPLNIIRVSLYRNLVD